MCQKVYAMLQKSLMEEPISKYADPMNAYTLFTDASKYSWVCVLTQLYKDNRDGKIISVAHPITYQSGYS